MDSAIEERLEGLPADICETIRPFYPAYESACQKAGEAKDQVIARMACFLDRVQELIKDPFVFAPYHKKVRMPFDYHRFGLDFVRPLVVKQKSKVLGSENLTRALLQMQQGDNVIFFANHQTEPDPQAMSILLEDAYPKLAEEIIFVAGHRVTTDPLAVPLSIGCDLLCIHSKRYASKEHIEQNRKTILALEKLLQEGGKCIYVAPSGGRDRKGEDGKVMPAPFDPQSIALFCLFAKKAKVHFYPLALNTFSLLPPPNQINRDLGEPRLPKATPIGLNLGEEIDIENATFPQLTKEKMREKRAHAIWETVVLLYRELV